MEDTLGKPIQGTDVSSYTVTSVIVNVMEHYGNLWCLPQHNWFSEISLKEKYIGLSEVMRLHNSKM